MTSEPARHFVTIDGRWGPRQVHYRRAGDGPVVLMLHQSPQSSRELVDLMGRWALHFTVIAPDTPGYGQTDPLGPAEVSITDFAAALLEFADALGLRRFGVYGYHTGATIGLWLASRAPERVSAVAANGLIQLTGDERRAVLAEYLPPVVPGWDGAHLAWLWARIREQAIFFPWHERTMAARMDFDVPPPERLQAALLEFLRAGDNYAIAYKAAFDSHPGTVLPGLAVPLLVTAARGDPLQAHLGRYVELPPGAEVVPSDSPAEALDRLLGHLLAHRGDPVGAAVATRPVPGRLWSRMVATADGPIHVRLSLEGQAEPVLVLHGAGRSSATAGEIARPVIGIRPVLVPDLPGHGSSHAVSPSGPGVSAAAAAILHTLAALGINQAHLAGEGAGACVALEVSRSMRFASRRMALIDVPWLEEELRAQYLREGLPSTDPVWHGGHLLLAWHLLRDARLFFPWFRRTRAGALAQLPDLDPSRLQLELRELLIASGAWQNLMRDALRYPLRGAIRAAGAGVALAAAGASPWAGPTRDAAAATGAQFVSLPASPALWMPAIVEH